MHRGIVLLLVALGGCASAQRERLTVAAAANLNAAFVEIGREFHAGTGIEVNFSFGSTANLAIQIEHGAPFDVFAAADVEHVEALERKDLLVPGTRAIYGRGRLALWAPPNGPPLERLQDLSAFRHIAVANPSLAPYGAAAIETLKALRLWEDVRERVVYAENIIGARQYAESGNADAAFTAYSLVMHQGGKTVVVPENLHTPLNQAIAVIRSSAQRQQALEFVRFVLSGRGRAILGEYGYEF